MQKPETSIQLSKVIDQTKYYNIIDEIHMCCDAQQFIYYCKAHEERMGCYFCEFDYTEPCDCAEYE